MSVPKEFTIPVVPEPDNANFELSLLQQFDGVALLQKIV
jgi:hypothetical protein